MDIIEAIKQLKTDLYTWVKNNLKKKVDVVEGKGLSTEDYSTTDKTNLNTHIVSTTMHVSDEERTTWNNKSELSLGETATTAAAGDHTHAASLASASSSDISEITLAHGAKFKLTAGGDSVVFSMPPDNNTVYDLVGTNGTTGLIKNGSSVTSSTGYTACPIVGGVPYYKDTDTKYTITIDDEGALDVKENY